MVPSYRMRSRLRTRLARQSRTFLISRLAVFIFGALLLFVVLTALLFAWYSKDLPRPGKLSSANLSQSTRIFDRNEILLYSVYSSENRIYISLSDIPKTLQEATIAIEDKDFYKNQGFSISGYLRAIRDIILFRKLTGGSTITQQLIKNTLLSSERTIPRKIKEFILAVQVDKKYSKDQILELYLNSVSYGGTAVGVEAASQAYFGKKASELDIGESAILAGLPQRPSYYSPFGPNTRAYQERTKQVLRRMREDGYITKKQEEEIGKKLEEVKFLTPTGSIKAPHFSFYVKDLLIRQFGEQMVEQGGLQVTTALDYKFQQEAEKIVKEEVERAKTLKVGNGASIVLDSRNGEILSMVGSRDFFATEAAGLKKDEKIPFEGQFNVVVQGLRQPGSAVKPVTYATALEKGYTAATLLMDTKTVFPNQGEKDYIPENYDKKFHGPVQIRFTLGSSINVPAVKMLAQVGIKEMLTTAYNMGLTTLAPTSENTKRFGLSITLGGGEIRLIDLAVAYSTFANGGLKVEPVAILKVTDNKGKILFEAKPAAKKRVLSEEVAFLISHILLDNNARLITFGENSYLNVRGRTIAVKTGTTDDKRDNWTIGWTPTVLVAAWVGNNDNSPMGDVASGVTGAAPIWRRIILETLKGKTDEAFEKPDNVVALNIDALGGGIPVENQATRVEYFIKGTEPRVPSSIYKQLKVSRADTNKLASESEIEKGEYELRKFIVFEESDPVSTDGKNRWQEGISEWINEKYKDDPLYHPPTETSARIISSVTPTPASSPTPTLTPTP